MNQSGLEAEPSSSFDGSLISYKLFGLAIIWLCGFAGGLVPLRRTSPTLVALGNCFSGGIFLGAGLLHMLAEAVEGFQEFGAGYEKHVYLYFMGGIMLPFAIERVVMSRYDHSSVATAAGSDGKKNVLNVYLLLLMLSVHALIEGTALGVQTDIDDVKTILFAILAHKFFAGFAMGVSLVKASLPTMRLVQLVLFFSLTTPTGIVIGLALSHSVTNALQGSFAVATQAVAAGTFIYVALVEVIVDEFGHGHSHSHSHDRGDFERGRESGPPPPSHSGAPWRKFLALLAGVAVTTYVALTSEHHHHQEHSNPVHPHPMLE